MNILEKYRRVSKELFEETVKTIYDTSDTLATSMENSMIPVDVKKKGNVESGLYVKKNEGLVYCEIENVDGIHIINECKKVDIELLKKRLKKYDILKVLDISLKLMKKD